MEKSSEVKSEKARNVILSYEDTLYFVSQVNVQFHEGDKKHKATFHAKRIADNHMQDLELEISQSLYNVLVEYTKMDNFDLILILHIETSGSKWCLMSENWLRNCQIDRNTNVQYII
jgi:hypothetical protein